MSSRSSGLANRALITPTDQPSAASASAAAIPRATIGPNPTSRMSEPSRSISPRPIGSTSGWRARDVEAGVARVVQGERVVLGERGPEERAELLLVLRAGDDQVRDLALGGQGEHPLVARPVLADEARPVDRRGGPAGRSGRRRGRSGRRPAGGTSSRSPRRAGWPPIARPVASVTACCSAIPTSKNRSGNSAWKRFSPVPVGIPAVIATIRRSARASSISSALK